MSHCPLTSDSCCLKPTATASEHILLAPHQTLQILSPPALHIVLVMKHVQTMWRLLSTLWRNTRKPCPPSFGRIALCSTFSMGECASGEQLSHTLLKSSADDTVMRACYNLDWMSCHHCRAVPIYPHLGGRPSAALIAHAKQLLVNSLHLCLACSHAH